MTHHKISASTLARTAALALALTNQVLSAVGKPMLPIESAQLEQLISSGLTVAAALASWWNNNSFTPEAIEADDFMTRLKKQRPSSAVNQRYNRAPEQTAPGLCVVFEEKFLSGVLQNILCGHMAVLYADDSGAGIHAGCLFEKARVDGHASHQQDSQCKADQTDHHTVNILVHDTFSFSSFAARQTPFCRSPHPNFPLRTPSIGPQRCISQDIPKKKA